MDLEFGSLAAQGLPRYIRLVADALGLVGESSFVQFEPIASAYLALDGRSPSFPAHDVALIWDEVHGWAAGIETSRPGDDLVVLAYLDNDDVLPAPRVVAQFAQTVFSGEISGRPAPRALRAVDDDDDLQARLAEYASWQLISDELATAMPLLRIDLDQREDACVLTVHGELDMVAAPELTEAIATVLAEPVNLLVLDLRPVTFIGSAGLTVLVETHERMEARAGRLLIADGDATRRVINVAGLHRTLSTVENVDVALAQEAEARSSVA